jgi:hypothetical protein
MSNHAATRKPSARDRLKQPLVQRRENRLVGGVPQVSLLPGEILEAGHAAHHRRRLLAAVVVAAVVAAGAVVVASDVERTAQTNLDASAQRTQILSAQLAKFDDVRALERRIALSSAGVKVGASTHIDWNDEIGAILAEQPAGYTVSAISASGATPLATYAQGATAAEPRRAATVVVTLTTASVGDEFSIWLRRLQSVPAYADATATTSEDALGVVTVTLTVHLNATAITADTESE